MNFYDAHGIKLTKDNEEDKYFAKIKDVIQELKKCTESNHETVAIENLIEKLDGENE